MKCNKCGTEVNSWDKFCPNCGGEVSAVPKFKKRKNLWIIFSVPAAIIVVLCMVFPAFSAIAVPLLLFTIVLTVSLKIWRQKKKSGKEVEQQTLTDKETQKLAQYFVNKDEKYISSLGNGYIMNYLANGSFSEGFSVITNKRVYFRGSCFSGQGNSLTKTNEERTVDIKDVTGSGFVYKRYSGVLLRLIVTFIVFVAAIVVTGALWFSAMQDAETYQREARQAGHTWQSSTVSARDLAQQSRRTATICASIAGICLSFAVICILTFMDYLMKRKTFFQIQYAGGCIAFNVSYYAKAEIDDFQKQLRRAKDLAKESLSKITVTESPMQTATQNSVPDDLRKYADLLKEGLISQEEYDATKKKILGL